MKLVLVTGTYPYGSGETFLENEIAYLAKVFDGVYIYPCDLESEQEKQQRAVPDNVYPFFHRRKAVKKRDYVQSLLSADVRREIRENCTGENSVKKTVACCFFDQTVRNSSVEVPEFVRNFGLTTDNNEKIVVYSYWLSTIGATALKIAQALRENGYQVKTVSRCHGFDVYQERAHCHYQPFQEKLLGEFEKVFPCSMQGTEYLAAMYPAIEKKLSTAYLGVPDRFQGKLPQMQTPFRIVSCSNVIPVKRVPLIAEALEKIDGLKIEWIHFGDGEQFEKLKEQVKTLPQNIHVSFPGRVSNREIYEFYATESVNLFVNVSSSEGLPVSIMETMSFGIPVIATDVGGTAEIVQDRKSGCLLKKDFDINELATQISHFVAMDEQEYLQYCREARSTYEEKFSAEKNYTAFCNKLKEGI